MTFHSGETLTAFEASVAKKQPSAKKIEILTAPSRAQKGHYEEAPRPLG
ncbi:MAG: hypothetical protein KDJ37_15415 [Hyphomicrobiaceae bacterium]|nr:hypothetical protein [Hyphomicrobiaceae bacterium]